MAGFQSMDDFITQVTTNGRSFRVDWNKLYPPTTAGVSGEWACLARGAGNPPADTLYNTGTNLTFQPTSDTTTGAAGVRHGGNVSPYYKSLINISGGATGLTSAPAWLHLIDLIGFYRVTSVTTITSQAMTNTLSAFSTFTVDTGTDIATHTNINLMQYTRVQLTTTTTLPAGLSLATDYYIIKVSDTTCKFATSYANAVAGTPVDITTTGTGTHTINTLYPRYTNGAGVQAFMWNTNSTALGAATPNLSFPDYTNSEQTTGKATPTVLPIGKTAAPNGKILYSGAAAGKYGPMMPLAAGDSGIAQVNNVQISSSYLSGEFSIGMYRTITSLPLVNQGLFSERDLVNQLPSMPRIYDGANLQWLIFEGANIPTNSPFYGTLEFAWA